MVNYLQIFTDEQSMKNLDDSARDIIDQCRASLDNVLCLLCDGTITVHQLQFILKHQECYSEVMAATGQDKTKVQQVLSLRGHELQVYVLASSRMEKLFEHLVAILKTGDFDKIRAVLEQQREKEATCSLNAVVDVVKQGTNPTLTQYKPKCNPWQFPEEILLLLPDFDQRISCLIFDRMLSQAAKHQDLNSVPFWRAFLGLWKDVSQEWQALRSQLMDGSVHLGTAESVFSIFKASQGKYNFTDMEKELKKMASENVSGADWVDERIRQFSCYVDIKKYVSAASALLEVYHAYEVKGSFADITKICSLSQQRDLPMKDLDESVLGLCKQLEGITADDIQCLEGLVEQRCIDFFHWVKKNMKDGLKELNVFVDLAFISAGEEPMSIQRVNCFHAAATGYAPLIFTDEVKDCKDLLKQCKRVFANVKADPNLPQKLGDTIRYLDWFKDVQKTHGSVEKTSLSQVGNINERGVFRLTRGQKAEMAVNEVIQLNVSEDKEGKTPARGYSYDELLDLQSRLMLVAEKGNDNVDRFLTIMESLVRLGKTYVHLCHDGCVLFLEWTVTFLCDTSKPVCCVSQFANHNRGQLKGHRTSGGKNEDIKDFIAGVASFLERCHSEWLCYVAKKRKECPELNVYTVEQLVFLQQQLVNVSNENFSKLVYPMLSLLKADCTPQDLEQALDEAVDRIEQGQHQAMEVPSNALGSPAAAEGMSDQDVDEEKVALFVGGIMDCGYSRELALKALSTVDVNNITDGIAWCMKHEEDEAELAEVSDREEEMEDRAADQQQAGQRLKGWVKRTETITQSAIGWLQSMDSDRHNSVDLLTDHLNSMWRKFLEMVSSSGEDFLSLEHLGIVLSCLADKDGRRFQRQLPPSLKAGVPNLILCPKREMLNVVTYMYTFPEDVKSLLPQPDEVLLCTHHTTFEQVDMLLRRAMFGSHIKVYTLAFADSLDYDVGEKVEKRIKEYINEAGAKDYKLVVVCATENEFRARIVAALEKYRRPTPSLVNSTLVQKYLHGQFYVQPEMGGYPSASSVDPEG